MRTITHDDQLDRLREDLDDLRVKLSLILDRGGEHSPEGQLVAAEVGKLEKTITVRLLKLGRPVHLASPTVRTT